MNKHRAASIIAAASALALAATACSSAKQKKSEDRLKAGCKIVYIPQSLGNSYFQPISDAFKSQASSLGFKYQEVGPSDSAASSQIPFIESAVKDKSVCGLAISPNNENAPAPALKRAREAGIVVLSVNSPVQAGAADVTITPADFSNIGPFMADMLGEMLDYSGKWAILSATQDAPGQTKWIKDIEEYQKKNAAKFAKMKRVDIVYGNDEQALSATVMQGLLTKYSDLDAVLAPTAAGLPAAAKVLSQSPKKGKIVLTGLAQPKAMKPYVLDGTVEKFALWDIPQEGIVGAQIMKDLLDKKITKSGDTLAGVTITVNGKTLTADSTGTFVASELIVFDKSNIENYKF